MTESINDAADGQQCGTCGGRIDEGEGTVLFEDGDPIAYVHATCA